MGNVDYGDDGFGVRLAEVLLEAGVSDVVVAGAEPERYIGRTEDQRFDRILFLDAVDFGATPGSVALLSSKQICARYPQVSTHKISLGVLAKWMEASGTTKVWLLGVQPESLHPGETQLAAFHTGSDTSRRGALSPAVTATLRLLRDLLVDVRTKQRILVDPMDGAELADEVVTV